MNIFTRNKSSKRFIFTKNLAEETRSRNNGHVSKTTKARSLRNDQARTRLGRYVETELSNRALAKLGRYEATGHVHGLVAT